MKDGANSSFSKGGKKTYSERAKERVEAFENTLRIQVTEVNKQLEAAGTGVSISVGYSGYGGYFGNSSQYDINIADNFPKCQDTFYILQDRVRDSKVALGWWGAPCSPTYEYYTAEEVKSIFTESTLRTLDKNGAAPATQAQVKAIMDRAFDDRNLPDILSKNINETGKNLEKDAKGWEAGATDVQSKLAALFASAEEFQTIVETSGLSEEDIARIQAARDSFAPPEA
jgi:hypothetical protein